MEPTGALLFACYPYYLLRLPSALAPTLQVEW
jgi:hypothetical protein